MTTSCVGAGRWHVLPESATAFRRLLTFGLLALVACGEPEAPAPLADAPSAEAPAVVPPAAEPPPAEEPPGQATLPSTEAAAPGALVGATTDPLDPQCRARVEGPEQQGECQADADCARGGCSGEICATPAALADLMSTCEELACFQLLDTCGCIEGRCAWTLKSTTAEP